MSRILTPVEPEDPFERIVSFNVYQNHIFECGKCGAKTKFQMLRLITEPVEIECSCCPNYIVLNPFGG